jgi:hypothetical protein
MIVLTTCEVSSGNVAHPLHHTIYELHDKQPFSNL